MGVTYIPLLPLVLLLSLPQAAAPAAGQDSPLGVRVYPAIPGIAASTRFSARVHDGRDWHPLFTMETVGPQQTQAGIHARGIYETVTGHSASWCTFEMDVPVTVEITRLGPGDIDACVIRPRARGLVPLISEDKRSVRFVIEPRFAEQTTTGNPQVPVNVAIEINGQTQEMMTVFASPHLSDKPAPGAPGVLPVEPGSVPPVEGDWHTLYFLPGVHDLGQQAHPLRPGKRYYVPGDAWVDGGFGEGPGHEAPGAKLYGLGVISGRKIGWLEVNQKTASKLLHLFGADAVVEGLTFIDSPHHTWMGGSSDPERPTVFRNIKCHSWRTNTDGLHIFGSGIAEDVFFHGQDDAHYLTSRADRVRFRRWVYWRDDTFGVHVIFSANGAQITPGNAMAEDCDSIYNDSTRLGHIIELRSLQEGCWVDGAIIRDLRIENDRTLNQNALVRLSLPTWPCSFKNVLLKNITASADNGQPWRIVGGGPDSIIENVTFEDIRMGERWLEDFSPENFTLAFVKNLRIVREGRTVATYSSNLEADAQQIRPDPGNLLVNPGFEIAGYGWTGRQLPATAAPAHEGRFAFRSLDERGEMNSIQQNVTAEIVKRGGGRYQLTAWMRIGKGRGAGVVSLEYGQLNRASGARDIGSVAVERTPLVAGQWVKVTGQVTVPWDRQRYDWLRWVHFRIKGHGSFEDLAIDDCRLEHLGE